MKKALFSSLWQKSKKHPVITSLILTIALVALVLIGYMFDGTGFGGGDQITTTRIVSGPSAGAVTQTVSYQQGKTLWDWLQLLIVPAVLVIGGTLISTTINRNDQEAAKQRDMAEREAAKQRDMAEREAAKQREIIERAIATDNQQEATLQSYLDKISELLLEKGLRYSQPGDEVRNVARVRTLTALFRLDHRRKKSLLQFSHEAGLIDKNNPIILLHSADFCRADLEGADLKGANLEKANLNHADLRDVDLSYANLNHANLDQANLMDADLSYANLNEAILGKGLAGMRYTEIRGASLGNARLNYASLHGAFLDGVIFSNAKLRNANLSQTFLGGAIMEYADLRDTDMSEAQANYAILEEANLSGANLSGANLSGANLSGADLSGANLSGADLSGADLSGAIVRKDQLAQAKDITGIKVSANF